MGTLVYAKFVNDLFAIKILALNSFCRFVFYLIFFSHSIFGTNYAVIVIKWFRYCQHQF